jgi:F-type H+-transporting ATPase subunit b
MIIDWYTVMFQIINFMVLVFLLRRFLYGPIVEMMEAREMKIVQREDVAATKASEAEKGVLAYQQKVAALRDRDEELLAEAKESAENERRMLLEATRSEVDETRKRWHQEVIREQESFMHELRTRVGQQACLIARQCLQDLADVKLEAMIWDVFFQKLEQLSPEEDTRLHEAFSQEKQVLLISSFEPTEERLQSLSAFLEKRFKSNVQLKHQTNSELICGVELEVGGYRVAWSVDEYLEGVEKEILGHLHRSEKEASQDAGAEQ